MSASCSDACVHATRTLCYKKRAMNHMQHTKIKTQQDSQGKTDTVEYLTTVVQELSFLSKLFERVFRIGKTFSEVNGIAHRIVEFEKVLNNVVNTDINPKTEIKTTEKYIEFRNVTISTPIGEVLIRDLNLTIDEGNICLFCLSALFGVSLADSN